jgi:hypothetical protein
VELVDAFDVEPLGVEGFDFDGARRRNENTPLISVVGSKEGGSDGW